MESKNHFLSKYRFLRNLLFEYTPILPNNQKMYENQKRKKKELKKSTQLKFQLGILLCTSTFSFISIIAHFPQFLFCVTSKHLYCHFRLIQNYVQNKLRPVLSKKGHSMSDSLFLNDDKFYFDILAQYSFIFWAQSFFPVSQVSLII